MHARSTHFTACKIYFNKLLKTRRGPQRCNNQKGREGGRAREEKGKEKERRKQGGRESGRERAKKKKYFLCLLQGTKATVAPKAPQNKVWSHEELPGSRRKSPTLFGEAPEPGLQQPARGQRRRSLWRTLAAASRPQARARWRPPHTLP